VPAAGFPLARDFFSTFATTPSALASFDVAALLALYMAGSP
jgi:hypothetical protein